MGRGFPRTGRGNGGGGGRCDCRGDGGGDGGGNGRPIGGGYLRSTPLEHSYKIHYDQAHYIPVSGGGVTPGYKGVKSVVGAGVP